MNKLVGQVVSGLKQEVAHLPKDFYDTFQYTVTGKNYTHPVTWAILSKILWSIADVKHVAIDFRLNKKSATSERDKFQPDLVALAQIEPLQPKLFLDYESPNSSDMRIPKKDVKAYVRWSKANDHDQRVPYVIITTLPDGRANDWQLRYTSPSGCNREFWGQENEVRNNPFEFWYKEYRKAPECLEQEDYSTIYFININGNRVSDVTSSVWPSR